MMLSMIIETLMLRLDCCDFAIMTMATTRMTMSSPEDERNVIIYFDLA